MLCGEDWASFLCLFCPTAGSQGKHHVCDVLVYGVREMLASEWQLPLETHHNWLLEYKESGPVCSGWVDGGAQS